MFTILFLLASIEMGRWRARRRTAASLLDAGNPRTRGLLAFTRLLVVIAVTTLLLHWLAFHLMQLLLPKDRTALFFVTFWTLAFGGAIAVRLRKAKWDVAGSPGLGVLIVVALYFFGCLRLGYFREWKWDMDTKQVYWIQTILSASIHDIFAGQAKR